MKARIIALSAALLIASGPVALAQDPASKTSDAQHRAAKKHQPVISSRTPPRETQAKRSKKNDPRAFGYVPNETLDRETEITRKAGGGSM